MAQNMSYENLGSDFSKKRYIDLVISIIRTFSKNALSRFYVGIHCLFLPKGLINFRQHLHPALSSTLSTHPPVAASLTSCC